MPKLIGNIGIDLCNGSESHINICRYGPLQFKATCDVDGKRLFGCQRDSIVDAIEQLILRKLKSVSIVELKRVITHVSALLQARDDDMQLRQIDAKPLVAKDTRVKVYHQIFGLFGDDAEMPVLFRESQARWRRVADQTGAMYFCRGPADVETLIKMYFPDVWPIYVSGLRFDHIERVDIARICILIVCGGMYIDMDCMPNREFYIQWAFAVCRVNTTQWKDKLRRVRLFHGQGKKPTKTTRQRRFPRTRSRVFYDMEAIIAEPQSRILIRWLDFIMDGINTVPTTGFFAIAKMRYVMHATGPYRLNRFLKLKEQRVIVKNMPVIRCNVQKEEYRMTPMERRSMDIISHDCCSWKTTQRESTVPVTGRTVSIRKLPVMRLTRRARVNTKAADVQTSNRHHYAETKRIDKIHDWIVVFVHAMREFAGDIDEYLYEKPDGIRLLRMLPQHVRLRSHGSFSKLLHASDDSD